MKQLTNNDIFQAQIDSMWANHAAKFKSFLEFYYKGFYTYEHNIDKNVDDVINEAKNVFNKLYEILWE